MAILNHHPDDPEKRQIRYLWSERPKMLQRMDDENKIGFEKIHKFALIALGVVTSLFFFYKILFG